MSQNSADYRCRLCGASIPWQSGVCSACLPPSGLERRETAFSDLPGGGVCRCLNPESPVVCEDCPAYRLAAGTDDLDDDIDTPCPDCGCWASHGDTCEGDGGCECHAYDQEANDEHDYGDDETSEEEA